MFLAEIWEHCVPQNRTALFHGTWANWTVFLYSAVSMKNTNVNTRQLQKSLLRSKIQLPDWMVSECYKGTFTLSSQGIQCLVLITLQQWSEKTVAVAFVNVHSRKWRIAREYYNCRQNLVTISSSVDMCLRKSHVAIVALHFLF